MGFADGIKSETIFGELLLIVCSERSKAFFDGMHNTQSICPTSNVLRVVEHSGHLELHFGSKSQHEAVEKQFCRPNPKAPRFDSAQSFLCEKTLKRPYYKLAVGFSERLRNFAGEKGFELLWEKQIEDTQAVPFDQKLVDMRVNQPLILSALQERGCREMLTRKRCAIELGVGCGKTEMVLNTIYCLLDAGVCKKALIIVPQLNLFSQTYRRIHMRNNRATIVGTIGDSKFTPGPEITVATIQTACGAERLRNAWAIQKFLETIDLLVIDEAHHSTADRYLQLFKQCPASHIYAVSGKLQYRNESNAFKAFALEGLYGPPISLGSSEELTCSGRIVFYHCGSWLGRFDGKRLRPKLTDMTPCTFQTTPSGETVRGFYRNPSANCYEEPSCTTSQEWENRFEAILGEKSGKMISAPTEKGIYTNDSGGWNQVIDPINLIAETVEDRALRCFDERNEWAYEVAKSVADRREPFLVTVKAVAHVASLYETFKSRGLKVEMLLGATEECKRVSILSRMKEGNLDGIIAQFSIVSEGLDIPNLVHLIKLDAVCSEQTLTQQFGRVIRRSPGKKRGYLHIPHDLQEASLARRSNLVYQYFQAEGNVVKTLQL